MPPQQLQEREAVSRLGWASGRGVFTEAGAQRGPPTNPSLGDAAPLSSVPVCPRGLSQRLGVEGLHTCTSNGAGGSMEQRTEDGRARPVSQGRLVMRRPRVVWWPWEGSSAQGPRRHNPRGFASMSELLTLCLEKQRSHLQRILPGLHDLFLLPNLQTSEAQTPKHFQNKAPRPPRESHQPPC